MSNDENIPAVSPAVHKSMQGNKRANTKPELLVRQRLRDAGLTGYRLQWKVPGRPDVAWPSKKVALFVNGCFWHRCPHCNLPMPKSHVEYWAEKFERNVARDKKNLTLLDDLGWTTHVIWECQLKKKVVDRTFAQLLPELADELGKTLKPKAVEYYSVALADADEHEEEPAEVADAVEQACGAPQAAENTEENAEEGTAVAPSVSEEDAG